MLFTTDFSPFITRIHWVFIEFCVSTNVNIAIHANLVLNYVFQKPSFMEDPGTCMN
jgi:hypothetical protein